MNRRVDHTTVGRHGHRVLVERRPLSAKTANRRRWSRGEVHEVGTIVVADALCPMGGLMTAERGRAIDARRRSEMRSATEPEIRDVSATPLAADVERILRDRTTFPETLWSKVI